MSRSSHVTLMGVFRGKTKREIEEMVAQNDPDIVALKEKKRRKLEARAKRVREANK